jgi:hypothetical protein
LPKNAYGKVLKTVLTAEITQHDDTATDDTATDEMTQPGVSSS